MARLRYNNVSGTLGASLTSTATSVTFSAALPGVATIASPDYLVLTVDPGSTSSEEIVYLTAYTSGATTGTIARAQEGTTAVAHNGGIAFVHAPTAADFGFAVINVKTEFGAKGDGTTDDTTAIQNALNAVPSSGGAVFFPAGTYVTSGGLTVSHPTRLYGLGRGNYTGANAVTKITCTSGTASLFTVSADGTQFDSLALVNTSATTPTAGAGITVTGTDSGDLNVYRHLFIDAFYIDVDIADGAQWTMDDCFLFGPVQYALRINHTDLVDGGDMAVTNCYFYAAHNRNAAAAVRYESGGGLRLTNCKVNTYIGAPGKFGHGLDVSWGAGNSGVLLVGDCSIENVTGNGINFATTGTNTFQFINVSGSQFGLYSNTTGKAISVSAAAAGNVRDVLIDGCLFYGGGGSGSAVSLTNVTNATIGEYVTDGFGSLLSQSGCTNVTTGTVSTVQYQGTALPSRSTLDFTGASVSVTDDSANARTVVTISAAEQIVADGSSNPPVTLTDEALDDWLYEG